MAGKLVETVELDNKLTVELWDLSRVLAGDRWLVSLEVRADVPLKAEMLPESEEKEKVLELLRNVFGDQVPYRYKQERHFVDQKEKDSVFLQFVKTVKKNLLPYLSHRDFAKRLVTSKVRELKAKDPRRFF